MAGIMYWICCVVALLSVFLIIPIPETFGKDLSDKIVDKPEPCLRNGNSIDDKESTALAEKSE